MLEKVKAGYDLSLNFLQPNYNLISRVMARNNAQEDGLAMGYLTVSLPGISYAQEGGLGKGYPTVSRPVMKTLARYTNPAYLYLVTL